jgi:molecular chaperone HscC
MEATPLGSAKVPGIFAPILERGTVIPASRVKRFNTAEDLQRFIEIEIYQGEHSQCSENQKLGEYKVDGIPPAPAREEGVDVRFTYDLNGILEVETEVVSTQKKGSIVIERTPGRLTPSQIAKAREAMARLKIHPRDLLPNTTTLARAEALFVELSGDQRAVLGAAIASMRVALELQEGQAIDVMRGRVNDLVQTLKRG